MSLPGKVIVITGASSGIGAELAALVARAGARPVLAARREQALAAVAARCGGAAEVVVTDVTRRAEVERLRDRAIERCGAIDVWVNNAGRGITRSVVDLTDEDFDEMMAVNVKSALYGMQAILPHFRARRAGHVINVSSLLGRLPYTAARSAYTAAKHALNALTVSFRMDVRADGIHVSLVLPGLVGTEFGVNALHGGVDSRTLAAAQPVAEVARAIADVIERPRSDVYTRPGSRERVAAYYAAEDPDEIESRPPFAPTPRR